MKFKSKICGKALSAFFIMMLLATAGAFAENAAAVAQSATSAVANKTANIPFGRMMGILSQNLTMWPMLTAENKAKAIDASVKMYRNRENTAILRSADFYVNQFDQSLKANPSLQGMDIMGLLKILAVMEYDFYNGQNKDTLARQVLGDKLYESVRMRRQAAKV